MLQQVLVGPRNLPSADLEVNFLWETEKALPSSAASLRGSRGGGNLLLPVAEAWKLEAERGTGAPGSCGGGGALQSRPDVYLGLQISAP